MATQPVAMTRGESVGAQGRGADLLLHEFTYRWDELRRAFTRTRTIEMNAPADPTSARTTVGFSGESVQPVCA
jgi:hypothetical protein